MSSSELMSLNEKAISLLQEDADKIEKLIAVQMENLATRKCPLYEEVPAFRARLTLPFVQDWLPSMA